MGSLRLMQGLVAAAGNIKKKSVEGEPSCSAQLNANSDDVWFRKWMDGQQMLWHFTVSYCTCWNIYTVGLDYIEGTLG